MTKEEIESQLRQGVKVVRFTKKDGSVREMPCTLMETFLPAAEPSDPLSLKKIRSLNDEVMVVWCTDKQAWRSFRVENVLGID